MKKKSLLLLLWLIFSVAIQGQTLIHEFNFNGNFNDDIGSAIVVDTNVLTQSFGADYWTWTVNTSPGGGLHLSIPDAGFTETNYSIGIDFMFYETGSGYKKIIDFKNLSSDNGFYFLGSNFVSYPTGTYSASSVPDSTRFSFIFTRDGATDTLKIYSVVNNVLTLEMEVLDNPANSSVPDLVGSNRVMWLFQDEPITFGEWTTGGEVYSLKIWNGVLSPLTIDSVFLLPTQLIDFTTTGINNQAIDVNWSTAQEKNTSYFEVERSLDGVAFYTINNQVAAGTSKTTEHYNYQDQDVLLNTNYYYRLKMVDNDGSIEYSSISVATLLSKNTTDKITVFPNPIHEGEVILSVKSANEKSALLKIYNEVGRLIYTQKVNLLLEVNNISIDTKSWTSGVYMVQVVGEHFSAIERVIKN